MDRRRGSRSQQGSFGECFSRPSYRPWGLNEDNRVDFKRQVKVAEIGRELDMRLEGKGRIKDGCRFLVGTLKGGHILREPMRLFAGLPFLLPYRDSSHFITYFLLNIPSYLSIQHGCSWSLAILTSGTWLKWLRNWTGMCVLPGSDTHKHWDQGKVISSSQSSFSCFVK